MTPNNVSSSLVLVKRRGKKTVYQVGKTPEQIAPTAAPLANERQAIQAHLQQTVYVTLAWLTERYPNCFNLDAKKPLEIGIHKTLRQLNPTISRRNLDRALKAYIQMEDYYQTLLQETRRYNLHGQACSKVTASEKKQAKKMLTQFARQPKKSLARRTRA